MCCDRDSVRTQKSHRILQGIKPQAKDDLERQVENLRTYLYAQGNPFEIITDIGSGINYTKKGLQELIRRIEANQVEKVVVLYKDRLLRFGFELLETIATIHGCK